MRRVWPNFLQLFYAPMTKAATSGRAFEVAQMFFPRTKDSVPMPFGLRWSADPRLGFARHPFAVFRRVRRKTPKALLLNNFAVTGPGLVQWGLTKLMYEVVYDVVPDGSVTVEPVDSTHRAIPGQRLTFTQPGKGRFRVPGIRALRVSGMGTLSNIRGTDQATYANLPDWKRIETVGFPYKDDEIAPPHYTPSKQGFEAPSRPGDAAARLRLDILRMLHLPPPASGISDFPVPPWDPPDIDKYLSAVRAPLPGQLGLITKCLQNTTDSEVSRLQAMYFETIETDGLSQGNIPNSRPDPARPSTAQIPVVPATILSITTDSWVSTALGYGTVDIPPMAEARQLISQDDDPDANATEPESGAQLFDYMVTASYELVKGLFTDDKVELAALAQHRPDSISPTDLHTQLKQIHRPPARDTKGSAAVRIRWNDPEFPQGCAIAVSRVPNKSSYLNTERVGNSGGFDAYVALTPAQQDPNVTPDLQRPSFTDLHTQVPFTGSSTSRYLVAGIDVFGQWSNWKLTSVTVNPIPVCLPGLLSAEFSLNAAAAVGTNVPADLTIEFGWDWDDRTPKNILFDGTFFHVPTPVVNDPWPPAASVTGLQQAPNGPSTGTVVIGFTATGEPTITSAHTGNVIRLSPAQPNLVEPATPNDLDPDSNKQRRYRLRLSGFTCKFNSSNRNAYCVYARAAETVAPARISESVGPKVATAFNPLPPKIPPFQVVNWTAMPDTTGRARALLTWTKDASAKGYVIYEASEAQLRALHSLSPPEAPAGTSWVARATELKNQIAAAPVKSLSAFVRLNMKLIEAAKHEIELPGSATNLFAYQVAAVSDANVESARSNVSFWAVPRRMEPGIPTLLLRKDGNRIKVIALPGGGVSPVGYRVFRVHKPNLASDLGLMGPPKSREDAAGWQPHQEPQLHGGPPMVGMSRIDSTATPSWFPYYYRIIAVGPQDLNEGQHRGESQPSGMQSILLPPSLSLSFVNGQSGAQYLVFRFSSNAPIKTTPVGVAKIEVFELNTQLLPFLPPVKQTKIKRRLIFTTTTDAVPTGAPFQIQANPTPAFLATLPQINRQAPNAQGVTVFSMAIKPAVKKVRIIRMTDPLSRSIEVEFEV